MPHLRFYRAILLHDAATVDLHAATLSRKQTRLLHHFSRFTILLREHSSKIVKLFYLIFFWTLRLISRFHFARQHILKLNFYSKNIILSHVGLVCLRDMTKSQRATAHSHVIAQWSCVTKSRDSIAYVWHRSSDAIYHSCCSMADVCLIQIQTHERRITASTSNLRRRRPASVSDWDVIDLTLTARILRHAALGVNCNIGPV